MLFKYPNICRVFNLKTPDTVFQYRVDPNFSNKNIVYRMRYTDSIIMWL